MLSVTAQVDRQKVKGFEVQIMRDHTKRRAFELVAALPDKFVETEKVLNSFIQAF